jgi:hypothetical protein
MKKLSVFCIVLLVIYSCEKDNQKTEIDYSIYISSDSIKYGINFYPLENYESYNSVDTPDLKLYFYSTKSFMGGIHRLACSKFIVNNELIVRFDSIKSNEFGFLEPTTANAYIDLPEYINRISLINGHVIDRYKVSISKEKVEIDSIIKNYTDVVRDKIFRYPENTFNFTCWTDTLNKNICTEYLNILFNELSLVEYEFNGEGRIPYAYYTSTSPDHYAAVFKYEKESDFDKAGELLETYTLEHIPPNEGQSISLFGWNNKKFESYTFY